MTKSDFIFLLVMVAGMVLFFGIEAHMNDAGIAKQYQQVTQK